MTGPRTGAQGSVPDSASVTDVLHPAADDTRLSTRLLLLGAGTGAAFAALAVAVASHWRTAEWFDGSVHGWVILERAPWNVDLANVLTWGGATIITVPALVVVGAVAADGSRGPWRRLGAGVLLASVAGLGMYLGLVINALINGERPDAADWAGVASGPTFPSGHTTSATIFAACCVWAFAPRCRTYAARVALCVGAGAYAVTVGLTRVWLGVHWPTDVLGGWLFGISWTALASGLFLVARRRWRRRSLSARPPT